MSHPVIYEVARKAQKILFLHILLIVLDEIAHMFLMTYVHSAWYSAFIFIFLLSSHSEVLKALNLIGSAIVISFLSCNLN